MVETQNPKRRFAFWLFWLFWLSQKDTPVQVSMIDSFDQNLTQPFAEIIIVAVASSIARWLKIGKGVDVINAVIHPIRDETTK
jgi:hypothetical protein